ncbi:MAG: amidase [Rhizomicrobium sp.]
MADMFLAGDFPVRERKGKSAPQQTAARSAALALGLWLGVVPALAAPYDVTEKSIAALDADLAAGRVSAAELVEAYEMRIARLDPQLHSVIALNPNALDEARALDRERRTGHVRGPLHGIPILVKDNIETLDPIPTTAGSLALAANITHRDAPVVARLRAAGAIILGKTNLSEWANIRSTRSISGWSAIGGLARNPYVLDRSTCGSSAGSGAAVAASLAAAALGTETNGSLVCPASFNGIVSIKPTVGLLSRTHIVPISHTQDTPCPMTRTVADTALLLAVMAASDPTDPATAEADRRRADYPALLADASLRGRRIGVILPPAGHPPSAVDRLLEHALDAMRRQGAVIVEIRDLAVPPKASNEEEVVLKYELKHDMGQYLQSLPGNGPKTLADLIAFDAASPRELVLFDQDYFEMAEAEGDLTDPAYLAAHDDLLSRTRALLDTTFTRYRVDALVRATDDPAFRIDAIKGDNESGSDSFLPAAAGYPHLTVPMGFVSGLPVGISFMGPAWSEARLLRLGFAFERATHARRAPTYIPSLESLPAMVAAMAPLPRK